MSGLPSSWGGERRYDPDKDPGNFPIEHWARVPLGETLTYDAASDRFLLVDACGYPTGPQVDALALQMIAGLGRFQRPGRFEVPTEVHALRFFQHEQFLRGLKPAVLDTDDGV